MEQDFQTSFIPKKPIIEDRTIAPRQIGLLTVISIFIFFTMLIASGILFFYKGVLQRNITQMANELTLAQNQFEPAKIAQLQQLDKRLKAATIILNNHIAVSPIFQALEALTMKTVSYTTFDYALGSTPGAPITVNMSGVAVGYRSIALQADLFSTNPDLIDPVFSNLSLDNNGNVIFDLQFSVDPSFVNYGQVLKAQAAAAAASQTTSLPTLPAGAIPTSVPSNTSTAPGTTATPPASTTTPPAVPPYTNPTDGGTSTTTPVTVPNITN